MAGLLEIWHARWTLIRLVVWARCFGASLAFAALWTHSAQAFPTSRLVYARGPGTEQCPSQDSVQQAVAARLGYNPFFPGSDKTIVARIARHGDRLTAQVELVDEHGLELGLRELSAQVGECDDLVHAMALSISIAIDPKSAETYARGPVDDAPSPDPASLSEADAATAPGGLPTANPPSEAHAQKPVPIAAPTAQKPSLTWIAGLGVVGWVNLAPKATLGAFGFASGRLGAWSLGLEGRADTPRSTREGDNRIRSATFALGVLPCFHLTFAFLCQKTGLSWLEASGAGAGDRSGTSVLLSIGGRLGAEVWLSSSLGLVLQGDVLVNPWSLRLVAQGQKLWQTPEVNGGLGLAAQVHFQ